MPELVVHVKSDLFSSAGIILICSCSSLCSANNAVVSCVADVCCGVVDRYVVLYDVDSSYDVCSFAALIVINSLKPNSSNCYTLPCRSNLPILIYDIRALWCSTRVPECQKFKMVG